MKVFASVVALVLAGLVGGWLWLNATAEAWQDTAGVEISGPVDPATATSVVSSGAQTHMPAQDAGRRAGIDRVVSVLSASTSELSARAEQDRRATSAKDKAAQEKAKQAGEGTPRKAVPVQPAPVNPGGWCEWDDDDGWECDDWDDDWDDNRDDDDDWDD